MAENRDTYLSVPKHKHNQINTSLWDPYLAKFITLTHITQMSSAGLKERTSCELWEFIPNGPVPPQLPIKPRQ